MTGDKARAEELVREIIRRHREAGGLFRELTDVDFFLAGASSKDAEIAALRAERDFYKEFAERWAPKATYALAKKERGYT